ncbi:MAG: glycosyl hydrolase [Verrucomicrobia bacterium]|nr:glycosyl hydrolase [Verrucomicrobiota bacterium]
MKPPMRTQQYPMKLPMRTVVLTAILMCGSICCGNEADPLSKDFIHPPDSARPGVYWYFMNGNMSREGITADLEAMKRAGIGSVLFLEVDWKIPAGPVRFGTAQWSEMFQHAVNEATRLGLELRVTNGPGYSTSGGPWIQPSQAMQKLVYTETVVEGPQQFEALLPQPPTKLDYYRDTAVLAFPTPLADADPQKKVRIKQLEGKTGLVREWVAAPAQHEAVPGDASIPRDKTVDLTANIGKDGKLRWDVPAGKWTILRIGHTPTGTTNRPSVEGGLGLCIDFLDRAALDTHFREYFAKRMAEAGSAVGKTMTFAHIDSWEEGTQNWTPKMFEEFQKRRGYDLKPLLPVLAGYVVESPELSERFLWDFRTTLADLFYENYAGHLHELAQQAGLKLSIEAYGTGLFDEISYAGRADVPMAEFWTSGDSLYFIKPMTSAAHTYGKKCVAAESFTSEPSSDRWTSHPFSLKSLGDLAFAAGVNQFFFHTFTHQPWLDRKPGMTMMWCGVHYERTQTWWEQTRPWHEYLTRCNHMLQQGLFVADVCYLQAEGTPNGWAFPFHTADLPYQFDAVTAEVVLNRMSVRDGRLTLPDGMNYRLMVLPPYETMTPSLLRKIKGLVEAGATVIGQRPVKSPSLTGYPKCDEEVQSLAAELWGDCDGTKVTEHPYGKGRILSGITPEVALAQMGVPPDLRCGPQGTALPLRYIHRNLGETEIYFLANTSQQAQDIPCIFRVQGKRPEFWRPDTGRIEPAPIYSPVDGGTQIPLYFDPGESLFVVFRPDSTPDKLQVVSLERDGKSVIPAPSHEQKIVIQKATYNREILSSRVIESADVTEKLQERVDRGERSFLVRSLAPGSITDIDLWGRLKTLKVDYSINGTPLSAVGLDHEIVSLSDTTARDADLSYGSDQRLFLEARKPGLYEAKTAGGVSRRVEVPALPLPLEVSGPWDLRFPAGWGAPDSVILDKLISWHQHPNAGIQYFSGSATYAKTLQIPPDRLAKDQRLYLDLGNVRVIAEVRLNGKDLGILWKPPFRVDITDAAKAGDNTLEVKVTNLWVNRLIGDEQLPEDSHRLPDGDNPRYPGGSLVEWPKWLLEGKPSPTGRLTFSTWRLWFKDSPLLESGLLGPVTLHTTARVNLP